MKIIPLSEGTFTIDQTKVFISFDKEKDNMRDRTSGSLLVEIQPFAVITSKDILLLDAGLGFYTSSGKMQIHDNLAQHGINPGDVTKILLSHLHKDHSGGVADERSNTPSFPNAKYYVDHEEYDYGIAKGKLSYIPEDFEWMKDSPQVEFSTAAGKIDDYISYQVCGGHCPYHRAYMIEENGERIFFGGDVAPQISQMKNRFIAKYDYDGRNAMELRQQWKEEGEKDGRTFLFYHDIKTPSAAFAL